MRSILLSIVPAATVAAVLGACASASDPPAPSRDAGVSLGAPVPYVDAGIPDADKPRVDGGYATDGGVIRADRFVTEVVRFTPGDCAGFGAASMPGVVLGPPVGAGDLAGGLDVVSLGKGGEIVVAFGSNAIVDAPGPDFIVFENAFYAGGDPSHPAFDLGEVSVSEDGEAWHTFPCTPGAAPPFDACAGWHPVMSAPANGVSPIDPRAAGGDAYDLAALGLTRARFVRVRDLATFDCPAEPPKPTNGGFDLDAVAIVHAETP